MNSINNAYTIVSLVFFFPYAICQPPATVAIRKIGPRLFLSFIVFGWGAVMIVSAFRMLMCAIHAADTYRASDLSTRGRSWPVCA